MIKSLVQYFKLSEGPLNDIIGDEIVMQMK